MRAALFLDFDNFFSGLMAADPASATALVTSPSRWLHKLTRSNSDDATRRWLVLRCYMNPAGWLPDPLKPGERLYFSKYRPFFTQAGFEVVDCPALTRGSKNGADIRIVIDVMSALRANTRYEEFVVASADADFTPLLQVLRADDRRISVIATSATATAYESLADRFLDEQDMFDLVAEGPAADTELELEESSPELNDLPSAPPPLVAVSDVGPQYQAFSERVREIYSQATAPINLARLSSDLQMMSGTGSTDGAWFGAGSFLRAVKDLELPDVRFSQHHLWDAVRHNEPVARPKSSRPSPPAIVMNFAEVTGMPTIASSGWAVIYQTLQAYAEQHVFNFTEASKWSRDQAVRSGIEIPRRAFTFAIRACQNGAVDLSAKPAPDAPTIARALYNGVLRRAELAGLEATAAERCELAAWLHFQEPQSQE